MSLSRALWVTVHPRKERERVPDTLLIYNLLAQWLGGFEFEFKSVDLSQ
jgi:hypothetical protein